MPLTVPVAGLWTPSIGHDLYIEPGTGNSDCLPSSAIVELDGVPATRVQRVGGSAAYYSWDPVPKAPQTLTVWYRGGPASCDPATLLFMDNACYQAHPPCAL